MHGTDISESERELLDALNSIDVGILLLTADLRARFANDAFLRMWSLRTAFLDGQPDFEWVMRAVATQRHAPLLGEELDAYVRRRVAVVRGGEEDPRDIAMDGGRTVRVSCKALPGGGRLLVYTDISDIVRRSEEFQLWATTDWLSGLLNRRELYRVAEGLWTKHRTEGTKLSALMIDIDDFKSINDRFGHEAGDRVISTIAKICRAALPDSLSVARFGGEEFFVIVPDTDIQAACVLAESLRTNVSAAEIATEQAPLRVTVSIGVSEATDDMKDVNQLVRATDQALYAAKRAGKDRVCTSNSVEQIYNDMLENFTSLVENVDGLVKEQPRKKTQRS